MDGYLYLSEAPDKLVAMIKFAVDYRGRWRAVESAFDDTIAWLRQNLILKLAGIVLQSPEGGNISCFFYAQIFDISIAMSRIKLPSRMVELRNYN